MISMTIKLFFFKTLATVLSVLVSVAFFTVAERKFMGAVQRRKGPDLKGYLGVFQAFADGFKLFTKETTVPSNADKSIFIAAPMLSFTLSLASWVVVPFTEGGVLSDANLGVLYLLAVSSLSVYGVVLAGWSSNSKYAHLGAIRSSAQMISYEIPVGFIFLSVTVCVGSLNLSEIVLAQGKIWLAVPLLPLFFIFLVSTLAETNRHPFDLPEAEAELVSGYNVEYSSMTFALFFLAEYSNMLLMSAVCVTVFLGGWLPILRTELFVSVPGEVWFSFKILLGVGMFILTRAALPRYRYDQLMYLSWKCFLPFTLGYFFFTVGLLVSFNWLP